MSQNYIVLGKGPKACVRTARSFDDKIGDFGHTRSGGAILGDFRVANARKCSHFLALGF